MSQTVTLNPNQFVITVDVDRNAGTVAIIIDNPHGNQCDHDAFVYLAAMMEKMQLDSNMFAAAVKSDKTYEA